jgi:hypothetical protein
MSVNCVRTNGAHVFTISQAALTGKMTFVDQRISNHIQVATFTIRCRVDMWLRFSLKLALSMDCTKTKASNFTRYSVWIPINRKFFTYS